MQSRSGTTSFQEGCTMSRYNRGRDRETDRGRWQGHDDRDMTNRDYGRREENRGRWDRPNREENRDRDDNRPWEQNTRRWEHDQETGMGHDRGREPWRESGP